MPRQKARDDAFLALQGASYHMYQMNEQFGHGLVTDEQQKLFHWHLRAFFWELIAVRDSLNREAPNDPVIDAAIKSLNAEQWFQEVTAYRNFAHQSFHVVEYVVPVKTGKAIAYQLQGTGPNHKYSADGPGQIRRYWDEMEKFLTGVFPKT
jgi:hypothetical protein